MKDAQDPHPRWEELAAFDLGRLSDAAWATVADHVSHCDDCSARLDTVPHDEFVALLRSSVTILTSRQPGLETLSTAECAPPPLPSSASPCVPEVMTTHPRYRVLGPLGSGGMGTVFKAEHVLMDRIVALKVLHPNLLARPAAVERFCREVKALARLTHPNIVTAYDAEQAGDVLFLVMEFVEGESLDHVLRRCGRLPVALARDWIRQAALGLQFAFEKGLVHRDLKPANLLLTPQGQVKILDFGLARLLDNTGGDSRRTPEGGLMGTPDYIAPEQARDPKAVDIRADLYSLGCTWYEMLTGRPPFREGTVLQKLLAHQDQPPHPITHLRPDVPPETNAILERLLAKNPADRFQTPGELLKALEKVDHSSHPAAFPRGFPRKWLGAVIGALSLTLALLIGVGAWWFPHWQSATPAQTREAATPKPERERRRTRDQAVAWLKANNSFGPEHEIVEGNGRQLDTQLTEGKAFILKLGPKLVKSGRPTILAGRHYDFFSFESPPETIDAWVTSLTVTARQDHEFHADLPVVLSNLRIDQKEALDGDQEVTGSVTYRTLAPTAGKLAVRLTFMLGTSTRTHYWKLLENERLAGRGVLPFAFTALYSDQNRAIGSTILFVDVCSLNDSNSKAKDLVLSNTVAELVTIHDTKTQTDK